MANKKSAAKSKGESNEEEVSLDPNLPLLPGNTVSFVARQAEGVASVTIDTDGSIWAGTPSNSASGARVAKIIETGQEEITVSFSEDGNEYASGTFTVG